MQCSMITRAAAVVAFSLASTAMAQQSVSPNRPNDRATQDPTATDNSAGAIQGDIPGQTKATGSIHSSQMHSQMADPVQMHFVQAATNLQANDRERAAQEIEVVSQFLQVMEKGATDKPQTLSGVKSISDTVDRLNTLAKDVRSSQADQAAVNKEFAHANLSIAAAQQQMAGKLAEQGKNVAAGYCLSMAASHLQQAVAWSGQSPSQDIQNSIASAQQSGQRLVQPQNYRGPGDGMANQGDRVSSDPASSGLDQSAVTAGARQEMAAADSKQAIEKLGTQITSYASTLENQKDWSSQWNSSNHRGGASGWNQGNSNRDNAGSDKSTDSGMHQDESGPRSTGNRDNGQTNPDPRDRSSIPSNGSTGGAQPQR